MSLHICIFSISSPYEPIHHQDPSEEAMTSAHRLEANLSYAYGGYLAGVELSHLLRDQSCIQLRFCNLLPSYLWYVVLLPHDLELHRFGCWGADLAGALGCRCYLGASRDRAFYGNMDKILIFRWLGSGRCGVFERRGSLRTGRALVLGPVSPLVSLKLP